MGRSAEDIRFVCTSLSNQTVLVIYSLFLKIFGLAARAASPWNRKARQWVGGRKGLMDSIRSALAPNVTQTVWMHCASLGEFEQGRPVLEGIRLRWPGARIILTFFSPSGYEVRKDYAGADHVFYLPPDSPAHANELLDLMRPTLAIFVKYEFWHYYLAGLKERGVPTLLISAIFRKGQPFFRTYGRFWRKMLEAYTHIFLQDEASLSLLQTIGFGNLSSVSGDTRFDRVIGIAREAEDIPPLLEFCKGHQVVVAGSTWLEDEETLAHYANSHTGLRFVIAPHEPGESEVKALSRRLKAGVLYSNLAAGTGDPGRDANVLIIDSIGLLSRAYRYATVAYIGGGFGGDGVHNVLEAAVFGKPIVMGPVYDKFMEAVDLVDLGGAFVVDSALTLEKELDRLMFDEEDRIAAGRIAGDYVRRRAGATASILGFIQENRLLTN
jgi:3-deoxy-D-manno-octulosonic-acid transferase